MTTFYTLDSRAKIIQVQDSTGGDPWDSTSWPEEDSTSTQESTFTIEGHRDNVPYAAEPFDSTAVWEQLPCIFQCPSGHVAYITSATLLYWVADADGQNYGSGDSTFGWRGFANFRFYTTGMPLDTTSSVWAPTNVFLPVVCSQDNPYGSKTWHFTDAAQPLNRPLRAGESLDLRVRPHDGPINHCQAIFTGYLVAEA